MVILLSFLIFFIPIISFAEQSVPIDPLVQEKKDAYNLTGYLPTYFLYHDDISKIQASFKYQVMRKYPLFFAYTHSIFWKLNESSKPIYDTNYNPEIFYRFPLSNKILENVDLIGYGHKSNGKEELESRSMDYAAVQFNSKHEVGSFLVKSGIRLRAVYNFDETNKDMNDYCGPYEFNLVVSQFMSGTIDKAELGFRFFPGGRYGEYLSQGGQEVSLSFRILGLEISPSFLIQYYHGYNEFLQNYNKQEDIVRFGFLL